MRPASRGQHGEPALQTDTETDTARAGQCHRLLQQERGTVRGGTASTPAHSSGSRRMDQGHPPGMTLARAQAFLPLDVAAGRPVTRYPTWSPARPLLPDAARGCLVTMGEKSTSCSPGPGPVAPQHSPLRAAGRGRACPAHAVAYLWGWGLVSQRRHSQGDSLTPWPAGTWPRVQETSGQSPRTGRANSVGPAGREGPDGPTAPAAVTWHLSRTGGGLGKTGWEGVFVSCRPQTQGHHGYQLLNVSPSPVA